MRPGKGGPGWDRCVASLKDAKHPKRKPATKFNDGYDEVDPAGIESYLDGTSDQIA